MGKPKGAARDSVVGDAQRLAKIDAQVSIDPSSVQRFEKICTASNDNAMTAPGAERAIVWERRERVAGFIVISVVLEEANINNIVVSNESQGQGIAKALMEAAMTRLTNEGVSLCMLEVRKSNQAALALYDQFGFVVDGVRAGYYRAEHGLGREDALLMSRPV